ncbi:MAG: serine/threonine-protein kinase [Candidatus Thiodiazotropha taylori]|nr:serine/threonine-protein kinase [Candidatus Thiodiazotropha taylori]MCG8105942.1 serine/threonine-protein kinase [Candidatus Thiodiazotropha taylori]MCG8112129.1 serine/threonine-protein kinase [Candidatus Thiodiazotropha taylori]MCW4278279.1 serine/threonine-protein kinase [Candidatus Thiodiazotropha taylori]MCW4284485.1 serine/threonine-protein kinase [Candidatus Thiodiazotropha taylori]
MDDLPELEGYHIIERIGEGGMATVYQAVQDGLERQVALKFLAPHLAKDEQFAQRFLREARIVGQLSHAHIVPVYEVGEKEGHYYLSMEWLSGGDLHSMIRGGLSETQKQNILTQITQALRYAHRQGFVHRDIKPDNILFRDSETAVVTDFGIARELSKQTGSVEQTSVESVIGSPRYMSPEQTRCEPLDARTDLYSLGVIAWLMLTGDFPHKGKTLTDIAIDRHNNPNPLLPTHLARWQPLCDGLLAYRKEDRFADCDAVLQALEQLADNAIKHTDKGNHQDNRTAVFTPLEEEITGGQTTVYTIDDSTHTGENKKKYSVALILSLVSLLAAAGSFIFWNQFSQQTPQITAEIPSQGPQTTDIAATRSQQLSKDSTPQQPAPPEPQRKMELSASIEVKQPVSAEPERGDIEPVKSNQLNTPSSGEYFAFRDTIKQNTAEAAESFLVAYPNSILSEIIRVYVLQQTERIAKLEESAKAGGVEAQLVLSELSITGWGMNKDQARAKEYAESAAQLDQPFTNYHLAALLLAQSSPDSPVDGRITRLLEDSADAGFFLAQTLLGNLLFTGRIEVTEGEQKGLARYQQAAAQGDRNALFNLGLIYDSGLGNTPQDQQQAEVYFKQAAALGHPQASDYIP